MNELGPTLIFHEQRIPAIPALRLARPGDCPKALDLVLQ